MRTKQLVGSENPKAKPSALTQRLPSTRAGSVPTHRTPATYTPALSPVYDPSRRNRHLKKTCNMKVENQDNQQKTLKET